VAGRAPRDPWRDAPVGELQDQVLPRWFVLTAVVMVPVAIVAAIGAFVVFSPREVPVAARRPPPGGGYTHAVGELRTGDSEPVALSEPCRPLRGLRVAGTQQDRAVLTEGLGTLCDADLDPAAAELLRAFAAEAGTVRFAQFSDTGVDSTASLEEALVLLNNRYAVTLEPAEIAPLVVHDLTARAAGPGTAQGELAARQAEAAACALVDVPPPSRSCADAAALLALADPLAALLDVGYR
jgi:hypothetical protein